MNVQAQSEGRSLVSSPMFVALLVLAAYYVGALLKGPPLDEFWTMFYTSPQLPRETAWAWWSSDTGHPVGYYLIMRIFYQIVPQSILAGRLLNIVPAVGLLAVIAFVWKSHDIRHFVGAFLLMIFGSYITVERFAEQRGYFWGLMLLAMLVVVFAGVLHSREMSKRYVVLGIVLSMGLALTDYMSFATSNALMAGVMVVLFMAGRTRDLLKTAAVMAAGWVLFLVSVYNSFLYPIVPIPNNSGFGPFAINVCLVFALSVSANLVLTSKASFRVYRLAQTNRWNKLDWTPNEALCRAMGIAVCLSVIGYAAVHFATHAMVKRQIFGVGVLIAALVSALAVDDAADGRWVRRALPFALPTLAVALVVLWKTPNFERFAPMLAEAQQRCSGYRIFALNYETIKTPPATLNRQHAAIALNMGYNSVARDFRFRLSDPMLHRAFDHRCGGAIWLQQIWLADRPKIRQLAEQLGFSLSDWQAANAELRWVKGAVLVNVPGES